MTYDLRETSMQAGEPIELYEFVWGANLLRFTSAKTTQLYNGYLWQPALIQRGSIDFTTEKGRNNLKLAVVRDFAIADLFRVMPPNDVIVVTVHRVHAGDSDGAVIWSGRVLNCEWTGSTASLNCEPISSSLQRVGLRRMYQRQCPHVLYGTACGVNKSLFDVVSTLSAVAGVTLTSTAFGSLAAGYLAGGFIEFGTERRFITEHTGDMITVNLPLYALEVGDTITAYAGCDHSLGTCHSKFNNTLNYGGMPYIPTKNPFGGSIF
jgi:uncharacterized phage protein (TIGR02218 family)